MAQDDSVTDPINLGNPHEMTIRELAERIIAMTGAKSKLVFRPLPQDDPLQRQPNITKAREILGWEPKVPIEAGLAKTIAYFESQLKAGKFTNLRRG